MFYVSLGDDSIVIFLLAVASSSGSFSISTSSSKKTNSSRYTFINVCKINVWTFYTVPIYQVFLSHFVAGVFSLLFC